MATTSNFVKMLQEIRGTSGIGATLKDGYYYEIAVKDIDGNLGMYGDIVAKHANITSANTSVGANRSAAELAASNASASESSAASSAATAANKASEAIAAENAAAASAGEASNSESAAAVSASNANSSAAAALASETSASNAANATAADVIASGANAVNAATSATNARNSESVAASAATVASNSATSANADALLAKDWATKDAAVVAAIDNNGTPLYSSRKYATDAMNYSSQVQQLSAAAVDVPLGGADGNTIGTPTASYDSTTGVLTLGIPHGKMLEVESITPQYENGNFNGKLSIIFTDGFQYTTPSLKGDKGDTGDTGDYEEIIGFVSNGNGTYNISFRHGATVTTESLIGPTGATGAPGVDVQSVHWISNSQGMPKSTAGTIDIFGVYSTDTQYEPGKLGEFSVYNGADGNGAGDMLYSANLNGLTDIVAARANLGVDGYADVDAKILEAVPSQTGVDSGSVLTTDGITSSWGYNPSIGNW